MTIYLKVNCRHVDARLGCRIMHGASALQRLFGWRPICVMSRVWRPLDGSWECDEQVPYERPDPPLPAAPKREGRT